MSGADEEFALKMELMRMDLTLKTKQATWETPRNIAILAASLAAIMGTLGGLVGYKIASAPTQPIVIYLPAPAPAATK